jgi:hypothetical protein
VIPIVGQDLLTVRLDGQETLFYPLLARRLAERLDISGADLPPGGELHEVARRYLATSSDVQDIYRQLRAIFRELEPMAVPTPLARLARIPQFKLYVTTSFDFLMERAINEARFDAQRQTLVFSYAPNDKQDLPREFDRVQRPSVYHLMGRFSSTPHSYAVTQEDTLRFIQSLQAKTEDSPNLLFDKLKNGHLLIIGSRVADWISSFFIKTASGGRQIEVPTDFFPGVDPIANAGSVLFLQRLSGATRVYRGRGAVAFVEELYRRVHERPGADAQRPPASARALRSGAVFLSFVESDRSVAESIRESLDRAGVDVVAEVDDTPLNDVWEKKLRSFISDCSLFIPVISRRCLAAQRRFFREDWVEAILEASKTIPSGRFILPVVIDDTSLEEPALPEELGEHDWNQLPGGRTTPTFVETVVQLQRSYRSESFA